MSVVMLVVFICCTLFSLVTAALVLSDQQLGTAVFFSAFGLLFGCMAGAVLRAILRERSGACGDPAGGDAQRPAFVPHWFVMTALVITIVVVLASILLRVVR